jgi:nucleolar protein 56
LDTNLPKPSGKKDKVQLGVSDSRIGSSINEALQISCTHIGAVPEILRGKSRVQRETPLKFVSISLFQLLNIGIRQHFPNLVKGLTDKNQSKAQLGLSHAYSRSKVKFNVNRVDNMIIQAIALIDQLDKDINTFAMRIR